VGGGGLAFREVVRELARSLREAGAEYCIRGALAAGYYGIPRATRELEVLIFPSWMAVKRFLPLLRKAGFRTLGRVGRKLEDFRVEAREGYRARFLMTKTGGEVEIIKRARKARFFGATLMLASPEDLIIAGLAEGGPKGITDAVGVMVRQRGKLDEEYLRKRVEKAGVSGVFKELAKRLW
jgi:hypothetical protein